MPPIIHCIRHAQGFHNVAGNYALSDPLITTLGMQQSITVRDRSFQDQKGISLVVASPMSRALQTATCIFEPVLQAGHTKILALPDLQETSDDLCDIGSHPSKLRALVQEHGWPVDLSRVEDGWNDKSIGSRYSPRADEIRVRARSARNFLRYQMHTLVEQGDIDCQIAVVTHGSFLHFFTDDWEDASLNPGTGWQNCEVRSYVFSSQSSLESVEEARLIETMDSRRRRGKDHPMFRGESQVQLYKLAMENWGAQGLQRPDQIDQVLE